MLNTRWIIAIVIALLLVAGIALAIGSLRPLPVRLVSAYPMELLAEEAGTMAECAECHEAAAFHRCSTCHDDHGAVEFAEVPFYAVIAFTGDVPDPGYVLVNEVLPYRDMPNTHVALLDVLASQGVTDFESVTLASLDEGFITLERESLTPQALLMPYADGIRFAAENLHVSTWLKGVRRIVVVSAERPLEIDGEGTSLGRLLLGPTRSVTVEQAEVMFKSEDDGQVRSARAGSRIEGAPLDAVVAHPNFSEVTVVDAGGTTHTLTAAEAAGALLIPYRGGVTLVLPDRGRSAWINGVTAITSQP